MPDAEVCAYGLEVEVRNSVASDRARHIPNAVVVSSSPLCHSLMTEAILKREVAARVLNEIFNRAPQLYCDMSICAWIAITQCQRPMQVESDACQLIQTTIVTCRYDVYFL